jgi:hypothetical protein
MPSTYTLNNGIELIATGEQSGTWGDTTNLNLGLVDTALDGQVTVTLPAAGTSGAPNALPISDGAASNGRNRLIIFADGGDLGATAFVQLTPNDAEKIVYIRNNLSGGRAIALFQGTYNAANDYEVPAGTTAVVFFNGGGAGAVAANVFNNAFFDSLRLGGVSVTAILDEDNMASDSATALATQQSIKAYVDAQVGANNELSEVLANGNTSGGTDIQMTTTDEVQFRDTALTIKSSVDGQLDIAADVELEIVAPTLDINASTAVTIDTTTLTMTGSVNVVGDLDVDNLNLNGNTIISTNTDGNIALTPNGTGEVDISKVDIDGGTIDGTVIGGSTAAAISGTTGQFGTSLNVDGTVTADGLTVDGNNSSIAVTSGTDQRALYLKQSNDYGYSFNLDSQTTGDLLLKGVTNGTETTRLKISRATGDISFYEDTGTTPKFFWDASAESLGIGTTSPSAPLSVTYAGGAVGAQITGNASYAQMQLSAAGANTNAYFTFGANGTGKGIIQRNATDVITIDSSGNVGIGTSSPSEKLEVAADTSSRIKNQEIGGNSSNWLQQAVSSYLIADSDWRFYTNSLERAVIDSSGNVGIGTSSPSLELSVDGDIWQGNRSGVEIGRITNAAGWYDFGGSSNVNGAQMSHVGTLRFLTASTERMRIDASGNLLVGTTGLPVNNGKLSVASSTSQPAARFYQSDLDGSPAVVVDKASTTNTTSQWFLGFTINNQATASGVITANGPSQATFTTWSDARLKENIADLPSQLDKIMALRPVEFDYIESEGGGHQISFIAQEFEGVYPDAIGERPDGMKTLSGWGKTEARLVKALQEAVQKIEALEARITALEA